MRICRCSHDIQFVVLMLIYNVLLVFVIFITINLDRIQVCVLDIKDSPDKREIIEIFNNISIGMDWKQVKQMLNSKEWNYAKLDADEAKGVFMSIYTTPSNVFGRNWVLFVHYEDRKVVAAVIRLSDNGVDWPENAPSDKIGHITRDYLGISFLK